jgi:GDP-D-mannose dehydratase
MVRAARHDVADDYVIATGEAHSVRDFTQMAFAEIGRKLEWRGKGVNEEGVDAKTGEVLVKIDPTYFRPTEVEYLLGDPAKARAKLGWRHRVDLAGLVRSDPSFLRPADATELVGDASRARARLGWAPTVAFVEIVGRMVDADLA